MRTNPFRQVESLANHVESMFDAKTRTPRLDISENDEELIVTIDAPGYEADDLRISVENAGKTLTIHGERTTETTDENTEQIWQERHSQTIKREVPLPTKVNQNEATAEHSNGVVTISLPKASPDSEDNTIQIEVQDE